MANAFDTEAMHFCITNGVVSTKMHNKRDDVNFEIVNFPFLMEYFFAPLSIVYTIVFTAFFFFSRVFSNVDEFNNKN